MVAALVHVGITRYHRPTTNYTTLRNSFVRDATISLRAFRVGALVLSHAAGFVQTQSQLATATGLSVTTVRAALRDLADGGYLASRVIREHGRVVGTAYAISDHPFTKAELAQLTSDDVPSEPCAESVPTESAPPKKTRSRRDSSPVEEDHPSGGPAAAGAAPTRQEEAAMKPGPDQVALFDAPAAEQHDPPQAGPRTVVAAYVDSYRRHQGGDPLKKDIGRIARDAKALLTRGEAGPSELEEAANELGCSTWSNLGMALKIMRKRASGQPMSPTASVPPVLHNDQRWSDLEEAQRQDLTDQPVAPEVLAMLERYTTSAGAA